MSALWAFGGCACCKGGREVTCLAMLAEVRVFREVIVVFVSSAVGLLWK